VGAGVAENGCLGASSFFGAANEKGAVAAGAGTVSIGLGVAKLNAGALGADDFSAGAAGRVTFGTMNSIDGAVTVTVGVGTAAGAWTDKGAGAGADLAASAFLRSLKIFNAAASFSCFSQFEIALFELDVGGSVPMLYRTRRGPSGVVADGGVLKGLV